MVDTIRVKGNFSLQKLSGISKNLLQPLSPENTYAALLGEAKGLFGAEYGSIFLWYRKKMHRVYTTIPESMQMHPRSKGFAYGVYKTGQPYVISRRNLLQYHSEAKDIPVRSLLIIPLSYNNQSLGVLTLQSMDTKKITKKQKEIMRIFGSIATLAIKKTQLYEETKDMVKMRDLFISLAAHELRTPLTTINAYVQLLKKRISIAALPEGKWLQELSLETSHIIKLVNELLNVNLIQQGAFAYHMKPVSLRSLIKRSLHQFSMAYPFHHIRFVDSAGQNDIIMGDADKLLQLMSSLLQNGAKFSLPNKEMILSLTDSESNFSLSLRDSGIGIPRKDIDFIFNGFYKGTNNHQEGIGLGLFLGKRIVEKHNGSIQVRSQKKKGTTVIVTLPKSSL